MADHDEIARSLDWRMLRDGLFAFVAYFLADWLRCVFWMKTSWPEHVEGVGSTLSMHAGFAVFLMVAWPATLFFLRWYRPVSMPWRWIVSRLFLAAVLAATVISAMSLVVARDLYPRAQIGLTAVFLIAVGLIFRSLSVSQPGSTEADTANMLEDASREAQ